jgi:hypothetical protein
MRSLCRIGCGCMLEYETHEFSDGFVYNVPRNLDNTLHQCTIVQIIEAVLDGGMEISDMNELYQNPACRLDISYEKFEQLIRNGITETGSVLGPAELWHIMGMLRHGKLDELIQEHQLEISTHTLPFLKYRAFLPSQNEPVQSNRDGVSLTLATKLFFKKNENSIHPDDMCNTIPVILPTDKGYQLEYLGYYYELMTKFQDAKKCYDLQYQFTEESELLEKSKELEKKIKSRNQFQKSIDDLTPEVIRKEIEQTELNLRKYIHELFSNGLWELFKKNPGLRKDAQRIRNKERDSMLDVEENSDIDTLTLGTLLHILRTLQTRKNSWFDGQCKTCGKKWVRKDEFFYEKNPIEINCIDETCFEKQGGLYKEIPREMAGRVQRILDFRNLNDHVLKAQDPQMLKYVLKETFEICNIVNYFIEKFLVKNQSA